MSWTRLFAWSPQIQTLQGLTKREATSDPTFVTGEGGTNSYVVRVVPTQGCIGRAVSAQTELRTGFWFKHKGGVTGGGRPFIAIIQVSGGNEYFIAWDDATDVLSIRVTGTGQLASVALPAALLTTNSWIHIGIFYKAHASSGTITVYVGTVNVLSYTGNTGSGAVLVSTCGRNTSSLVWADDVYFDNWYIDGGSGNSDAAPPAKKFLFSLPNGAGTDTAWTPNTGSNYAAVDDTTLDSDSTYVAASAANLRDNYAFAGITVPAGHIVSQVLAGTIAKKTSSADCKLIMETLDTVPNYDSSSALTLTTSYDLYFAEFPLDPTDNVWNETTINAAQFGYKSSGTFS